MERGENESRLRNWFLPGTDWWLTPVILATQEAEIRRIAV
jgi:hypothetical protein